MADPTVSGSVDVVVLGAAIAAVSHALEIQVGIAVGVAILLLGAAKVIYDHLTEFEDPLGLEISDG